MTWFCVAKAPLFNCRVSSSSRKHFGHFSLFRIHQLAITSSFLVILQNYSRVFNPFAPIWVLRVEDPREAGTSIYYGSGPVFTGLTRKRQIPPKIQKSKVAYASPGVIVGRRGTSGYTTVLIRFVLEFPQLPGPLYYGLSAVKREGVGSRERTAWKSKGNRPQASSSCSSAIITDTLAELLEILETLPFRKGSPFEGSQETSTNSGLPSHSGFAFLLPSR